MVTDIEYFCVYCEGLGRPVERGTDTEYCVCCEGLGKAVVIGTDTV
jgi:hypothetical protein